MRKGGRRDALAINPQPCSFSGMIPEIDIWRAAQLMLKRYGDKAVQESAARADELAAGGDHDGATTWRRITNAVGQLANNTPPGPVHERMIVPHNYLRGTTGRAGPC